VGGAGGRVDCRILRHLAPRETKASAAKKRYAAPRMATMRGATSWKRPSILLMETIQTTVIHLMETAVNSPLLCY